MDPASFTSRARGEIRRTPEHYVAFIPKPLPRTVKCSAETLLDLDHATGALYRLGGLGSLLPNPDLLMGPHVRLEAVLSSRIEGTKSEITDLLKFEATEGADPETIDDVQEVRNYVTALKHGLRRLDEGFPLSLRLLREMHELLMTGVRGERKTPGEFRTSQNWIGGTSPSNAVFVPPPVDDMKPALYDWEQFLHHKGMPLLLQLALVHYQFEAIHPFLDGNGRVGRLLLPLLLVERKALPKPLLYLSVYFEHHRDEYYDHLLVTSQQGDLDPWFRFFLRGVARQAKDAEMRTIRLVDAQRNLREELLERKASNTAVRLADLLFDTPYISAALVERRLGVTQPTARAAIETLEERGVLEEITGRRRGRVYFASHVFDAVYAQVMLPERDYDLLFEGEVEGQSALRRS